MTFSQMIKYLLILLTYITLLGCNDNNYQVLKLPEGYSIEKSNSDYNILNAVKYVNGNIISSLEIKYSDDWSFSVLKNSEYISEMISNNEFEKTASMMYDNFIVHSKKEFYSKSIGKCLQILYSGDFYSNNIRVTNFTIQFIKNNKLYTIIGSSNPENFSSEYKSLLKSLDTLNL